MINIIESEKVETVLQEEKLEELQPLDKNMIEYVCNFIPQSAKIWKDVDLETKGIFQEILFSNDLYFDPKTKNIERKI